ncbi:MAG: glycoside hydrolase family 78 protein [Muribaculaceae bacterium]|nr:glycoside hydrolase family 78 protein [Muribaculaceae bacterium]
MIEPLKNLRIALTAVALSAAPIVFAGLEPDDLRVNHLVSPLGIDRTPVFSWMLPSDAKTGGQSAYQIEVTAEDGGVVWDSWKVSADTPFGVRYEGSPLGSSRKYGWRVRVWDADGQESPWSESACFETALLESSEWKARWIEEDDNSACSVIYDLGRKHTARYVRIHATRLGLPVRGEKSYRLQLSELQVLDGDKVISEGKSVSNSAAETYGTQWQNEYLTDGITVPSDNRCLGATSKAFNKAESTVDFTVDLGRDMTFDRIVIYPRQDVPSSADSRLSANYPADYSIVSTDAAGRESVLVSETGYPAPSFSMSPENNPGAVIFSKSYNLGRKVRRARAYASGLGVFSLEVNGRKVTDNVLEPLQTDYRRSVIYSTYDITDHIGADGKLSFAATVAGGMYDNPGTERYSKINTIYGRKRFIMQVLLEYEDGTSETLATDGSWLVAPSPTVFASWYGGEDYDATYKAGAPKQVRESVAGVGELCASFSPALKIVDKWKAGSVRRLADGSYVVDFGTNFAGTYRFSLKGDKGSRIRIYPCEVLSANGGHGQTNGSCGTPVYDCYTFAGNDDSEEWGPEYVYHGFRYLQIFGLEGYEPTADDFTACVISSDVAKTGTFECSNPLLNRIHEITLRAIDSNLYSTLTDCPHREKLGWLEVPGLLYNTLAYNYDIAAWAAKVCYDCRMGQHANGYVPGVLPEYPDFGEYWLGDPSWGGTAIMLPYRHYQNHGDKSIILDNYATMKRLMEYYETRVSDGLLSINSLGDWGAYDKATSVQFVHNCVYYGLACAMTEMAAATGRDEDAAAFRAIADRVRARTNAKYYSGGVYDNGTQADYALPLYFGLVDEADKADVAARMAQAVIANNGHLSTGEIALRPLILSLCEYGYGDLAMEMLTKTAYPGYGYFVEQGATSLPEHWNMDTSSSSQNHCMMGHVEEWFYSVLAGIRPLAPAYRTFAVNPFFSHKLDYAGARVDTPFGQISSRWERSGGRIRLNVEVPGGTLAEITLPAADVISVNGETLTAEALPEGIESAAIGADATRLTATRGSYVIEFDDMPAGAVGVVAEGRRLTIAPVPPDSIRVSSDADCLLDVARIDGRHLGTIEVSRGDRLYKLAAGSDIPGRILIIGGKKILM